MASANVSSWHHDGNMDGSDQIFCLVPTSIKALWLSFSSAFSTQVAPSQHVHQELPVLLADTALAATSEKCQSEPL